MIHRFCLRVLIIILAFAAAAPSIAMDMDADFADRLVAVHNRERAMLNLPPVRWSASLAASAHRWASYLAATGRFEHAPANLRSEQGENLWAGTKYAFSLEQMVDAWAEEKQYFKPGRFPHNSTTGSVSDVGHYTQLVWRDTYEVGCAKVTGAEEDVLVCRYGNPGNYIGQVPF